MAQLRAFFGIGGLILFSVLVLLLLLYFRGAFHRRIRYRLKDVPAFEAPHFPLAITSVSASWISNGSPIGYWFNIDAIYAARNDALRHAQHSIHFETFFFTPGRRADEFAAVIIERAEAGVEIQLLIDKLGSHSMPKAYWQRLRAANVEIRFFHEFDWKTPLDFNIRTHRKLLLIDRNIAFVGGMGVSDDWDGSDKAGDTAPWLDFEVSFKGAIVTTLETIFLQHWIYVGGIARLGAEQFPTASSEGTTILVTPSSSPSSSSTVSALFYTSILAAKERVWIASPYFLPEENSHAALVDARKRGVDVRVLTVGPHNDKQLIYRAVRERYGKLLTAGIKVYEHQPSMLHAKVLLIDDQWVSTGSANIDPRSLFHNDELNLSLAEPELAKFVESFFAHGFSQSHRIDLKAWKSRSIADRFLGQLALCFGWQL